MVKVLILASWVFAIASFFIDPASAPARTGRMLFAFLVVAHLIECAVFHKRIRTAPGSPAQNFLLTFVFGVFHIREISPPTAES